MAIGDVDKLQHRFLIFKRLLTPLLMFLSPSDRYIDQQLNKAGEVTSEDTENFSKLTVMVTRQYNEDCKKLPSLLGVPVIEALSEANA
ncbi:hypothetical protein M8C21_007001 [Ambrosia artemisiifolia]|uniref:Uncharacterized protein n=1 Tax=Ambrosia artemisiifolia TaxID=4212 RepID=A0AAD5GKY8_AMBAR|nr:hypothetical protein M8C21_007001 [Ambrosia artemisiifolia]